MDAEIETGRLAGPKGRSKIRLGGHGPRAVALPLGLTARGACLLPHSFRIPTEGLSFGCQLSAEAKFQTDN